MPGHENVLWPQDTRDHPIKSEVVKTTLTGTCQIGDSITISLGNSDGVDKLLNMNGQIGLTSNF